MNELLLSGVEILDAEVLKAEKGRKERPGELPTRLSHLSTTSPMRKTGSGALENWARAFAARGMAEGLQASSALPRALALLTHRAMSEAAAVRIVRGCVPIGPVNAAVIVEALSACSALPVAVQEAVCRWAVMVFDRLAATGPLRTAYPTLLRMIEYEALRPHACYILCRITKRVDVLPFRVRLVKALAAKEPADKPLAALLTVFKEYVPSVTFTPPPRFALHKAFAVPDRAWYTNLQALESLSLSQATVAATVTVTEQPQQQQHQPSVPRPVTSYTPGEPHLVSSSSVVTASEIRTVEDLCEALQRAVLPDQLGSLLDSRAVQHLFVLQAHRAEISRRVSSWVSFHLQQLFLWRDQTAKVAAEQQRFLAAVARTCSFLRETIPEVEGFLVDLLRRWDGADHQDSVFTLVEHLKPRAYEDLHEAVLRPLHDLYITSDPAFKAKVIACLQRLLRAWAGVDWAAYHAAVESGSQAPFASFFLTQGLPAHVDYYRVLFELTLFADKLCVVGILAHDGHPALLSAALALFEMVSTLHTQFRLPFVVPPSPALVYQCLLSPVSMAPSRMAGIIAKYQGEFSSLRNQPESTSFQSGLERISELNGYILDFSNALWRRKRLTGGGLAVPQGLEGQPDSALSVLHSAAFAGHARAFLESRGLPVAVDEGDLLPRSILEDQGLRLQYLDHLAKIGHQGLHAFLFTFIKSLVNKK
jgi:hypothetical protein